MKWYTVKWVGKNFILSTVVEAESEERAGAYAFADLTTGFVHTEEALRNATMLIEEVTQ
jgi:hypothetical protein